MIPDRRSESYYAGCNRALLRAVPADARTVLDVGCGEGRFGAALKAGRADRVVYGVEREPAVAARAAGRLDRVWTLDVAADDLPLGRGTLDCVVFGDVLEHLVDPEAALRRVRPRLARGGVVLASIPNLQHYSMLVALLTGDFQYRDSGLLDATHLRFFTGSTILKMFLDAGYAPDLVDAIRTPVPPWLAGALGPLLGRLGLHPGPTLDRLGVYQHIVRARPLEDADAPAGAEDAVPLTVVTCVSDEATLGANLLASPCLGPGSPHEVLALRGCPAAAEAINAGLARARHALVVYAHQDVYLPHGWPARMVRQYRAASARWGEPAIAGVYGVAEEAGRPRRVGHVVDRDRLLAGPTPLPALVQALDELLLVLPRGTPLRADPALGFHFYGSDLALQAHQWGRPAVVLDAPCLHNSRYVEPPPAFFRSASAFATKWAARLPVATPCVLVDRGGQLRRF